MTEQQLELKPTASLALTKKSLYMATNLSSKMTFLRQVYWLLVYTTISTATLPAILHAVDKTKASSNKTTTDSLLLFDTAAQTLEDALRSSDKTLNDLFVKQRQNIRGQLQTELSGTHANEQTTRLAIQQLIAALPGAHGLLLKNSEVDYWGLACAFGGDINSAPLRHLGALFERKGKRWFVRRVLAGSPAAKAGLSRGDEILSLDGEAFSPALSPKIQANKAALKLALKLEVRHLPWETPKTITVEANQGSLAESLLRHMQHSAHVYIIADKGKDKKIGYIHLPMSSHTAFKDMLERLAGGMEAHTDALVLDLRDGFPGEGLAYIDLFLSPLATDSANSLLQKPPMQKPNATPGSKNPGIIYTHPLVVLIDQQTSGGRELLAYALQRAGRAIIVGETSKGWVHAGQFYKLSANQLPADTYALYFAPPPAKPLKIEGQGVVPEENIKSTLMYAAGKDETLDAALSVAAKR